MKFRVLLAAALTLTAVLVGGTAWVIWQIADQLGAPGIPSATGSGPCGSNDSVNIQLVFADGHSVQACTRDRPACANQKITVNGQVQAASYFVLSNQLRSSSRRYILFVRSDVAFAADMPEQTLQLGPLAVMPKDPSQSAPNPSSPAHAVIEVTPRDPTEVDYAPAAGSLTVSSTHGVVRGRFDGTFTTGSRPDRPQPTSGPAPVEVIGTFVCNQ